MSDITPQDYANDAAKGSQLQRFASDIAKDLYADIPQAIANALNDLNARLLSLESEDQNLGDVKADSLDSQVLKTGGVDVRDGSTTTVTFSQASSRSNVNSGETLATLFGKVRKWFADLGSAAWKSIVTSWSSTVSDNNIPSEKLVKDSLDNKVDKVSGKGLSTNDYTTDEKTKLDGIEAQANKYIHPTNGANTTKGESADKSLSYGGTFKVLYSSVNSLGHTTTLAEKTMTLPGVDDDVAFIEYGTGTLSDMKILYSQKKKLVLLVGAAYGSSNKLQYRVQLSFVMFDSNDDIIGFCWQMQGDDVKNDSNTGILQQWKLTYQSGWTSSVKNVAYATSADYAAAATPNSSLAAAIAPSADVFTVNFEGTSESQSAVATKFANTLEAYNAGKKIYCITAGTVTIGSTTYTFEKRVPLSYVLRSGGNITNFGFKDVNDGVVEGANNAGVIYTVLLGSTQWSLEQKFPYHADTATLAGNSYKWNGYELAVGSVGGSGFISYV